MHRAAYLIRIAVGPAALNFVINFVIGIALFAHRARVPWTDAGSVGADLMLGGFIVAAITAWASTARVQRDAEAGLVAGLSARNPLRFLLPRNRAIRAGLIGFLVMFALLVATVPPLESQMPAGATGWGAALFKGITSTIAALLAIFINGWRSLVGAPDHTPQVKALLQSSPADQAVPLEPIAIACLAATDDDHASSVAPTWRLALEGDVSVDQVREAFRRVASAAPVCRSIVRPRDALPTHARHFDWVPSLGPDAIPVITPDGAFETVRSDAINRHLDLFTVGPVHVTATRHDGLLYLFVQQHHGIADGRAFIAFLQSFGQALTDVRHNTESTLAPLVSRPESEAFGRDDAALRKATRRGTVRHVKEMWARKRQPLKKLPWSSENAASHGRNATLHVTIDDALLEAWRPIRKDFDDGKGVGANAILSAAYVRAAHLVSPTTTPLHCELVAETRPRDGSFQSFANHLSVLFVTLTADALQSLESTAAAIHQQVRQEVADDAIAERALFRGWIAKRASIDMLRPRMLDRVEMQTQLGFSNLTALNFPTLGDGVPVEQGGWLAREVRTSTPSLPPHGVMLTAIRYNGAITFNFNYGVDIVPRETVQAFATAFVAELQSLGPQVAAAYEWAV